MTANSENPFHLAPGIYQAVQQDFKNNPEARDELWKTLSHSNLQLALDILIGAQAAAEAGKSAAEAAVEATILILGALEKARTTASVEAQLDSSLAAIPPAA